MERTKKEVVDLELRYKNLRRTTMMLGLVLLLVLLLSILAFYRGWLGAPGKIYFSPSENEYYLRCADDSSICGELGVCQKIIIKAETEIEDWICLKK